MRRRRAHDRGQGVPVRSRALMGRAAGLALLLPATAAAQPPPPAASAGPPPPAASARPPQENASAPDADVALATALFEEGLALYRDGKLDDALAAVLRSRAIRPSGGNTIDAATLLDELGRYDEALDLYEVALARYPAEFTEHNRGLVVEVMANISKNVATIELITDLEPFDISVDGKPRRDLMDPRRLRVLGGEHTVRIEKNGFIPFETRIDVKAGSSSVLHVGLKPVGAWIHVEDASGNAERTEVFIDGDPVGSTPWQGPIGPGEHVIWIEGRHIGSTPSRVVAARGEVTRVRLRLAPLGQRVRVAVEPRTAQISLDGAAIGRGTWTGRLPLGSYELVASEPGYLAQRRRVVARSGLAAQPLHLVLDVDDEHPRWPRRRHLWAGAFLGYGLGPSLGSDAEDSCPDACRSHGPAHGGIVGLRGGYEFKSQLSIEIHGGLASFRGGVSREVSDRYPNDDPRYTVVYRLDHEIELEGPFAAAGASQRIALAPDLQLVGRMAAGLLSASSRHVVTGSAAVGRDTAPISVKGSGEQPTSDVIVLLMPEIGATLRLGAFDVGAALTVLVGLASGPELDDGAIQVENSGCSPADLARAGCAPDSDAIVDERAFGHFLSFLPQVNVRYAF